MIFTVKYRNEERLFYNTNFILTGWPACLPSKAPPPRTQLCTSWPASSTSPSPSGTRSPQTSMTGSRGCWSNRRTTGWLSTGRWGTHGSMWVFNNRFISAHILKDFNVMSTLYYWKHISNHLKEETKNREFKIDQTQDTPNYLVWRAPIPERNCSSL